MPVFSDVEQITLRVGPDAHRFGDLWERCCQGKVEHDRWLYLYGASGKFLPNEMMEIIRECRRLAKIYGWIGIRWKRLRKRKGVIDEHMTRFRINPVRILKAIDPHSLLPKK